MLTPTTEPHDDLLEPLLTHADLQRLLQVSDRTLRRWAATGFLPAPIKLSGRKRWRREDLRAFLDRLIDADVNSVVDTARRTRGTRDVSE